MTEGRKYDRDKARMDLIPPEPLFAIAEVLTIGTVKYEVRNWEKGMRWGRCFSACMRHLWAWWGGRGPTTKSFLLGDLDDETRFSHLWHAGCCIFFLIAYEERGIGEDDRLGSSDPVQEELPMAGDLLGLRSRQGGKTDQQASRAVAGFPPRAFGESYPKPFGRNDPDRAEERPMVSNKPEPDTDTEEFRYPEGPKR